MVKLTPKSLLSPVCGMGSMVGTSISVVHHLTPVVKICFLMIGKIETIKQVRQLLISIHTEQS